MEIQNPLLAGATMSLRYERDANDPSRPATVSGDERGVFDVPKRDAEFLLSTPGWLPARKARAAAEEPEAPEPEEEAAAPEEAAEEPAEEPEAEDAEESEEGQEADLDAMGKDALLTYAEEQGIEVNARWGEARLRAFLEAGGEE